MRDDYPQPVPDYTNACIVMFGVNVTFMLVTIWAIWGLLAAICLAWVLNKILSRLPEWRMQRRAASIRRGKSF